MHKTSSRILYALIVFVVSIAPMMAFKHASAASLLQRSVKISSPLPSDNTNQTFRFTIQGTSNIGSIKFEYCTNSPLVNTPCTAPTGFSASSAALVSELGETGFSMDSSSTANKIVLGRAPTATTAVPVEYVFNNIINPSASKTTVYVRLSTYATSDASGPLTDEGTVAFSTSSAISVNGYVPPYLTFCVGVTVALNCSSSSGVLLNFGELSNRQPRFLSSQFSVATNDPAGYATFVTGPTMTSGNNTIAAMNPPKPSSAGTSQFGMNMRANSNPAIGADPIGVGSGVIAPGFNTPNQFFYNEQLVASSALSSDFNAYTVSYIVNINANQTPGVYVTTLTYIASAAF